MPDQRNRDEAPKDRCEFERQTDNDVLAIMFNDPSSWPWSIQEIAREFDRPTEAEDAVRRLAESGLVHRLGDFAFPTRAARRAAEIEIGT
jgi:predicted transcriptional regulator